MDRVRDYLAVHVRVQTPASMLPGTVPFFTLVHEQPALVLVTGSCVLLVTVAAWWVATTSATTRPTRRRTARRGTAPASKLLLPMTAIATLSTSSLFGLIAVVLLQPAWCLELLCVKPTGPHDQFLESSLTAIEASNYVISGAPDHFTLGDLPDPTRPTAVAAQRIDPADSESGYRIALRVHSLQRGRFRMIIEQVAAYVVSARPLPDPLRVIRQDAALDYNVNPYLIRYRGERGGSSVPGQYAGAIATGHVQLTPGESDELTVRVESIALVDLQLRLRLTYRVVSSSEFRTLELPYTFRVVFSDDLNWRQFVFRDGHLVPS